MAVVRRALDRHFPAIDPGDAAWQGHIGLSEVPVRADVVGLAGTPHALVRIQARVVDLPLDGALAQAVAVEQASLPIGRLEHDGRGVVATASLLGGGTLDVEEAITAAYAVAAVAEAAVGHLTARVAGTDPGDLDLEPENVNVPRDADERITRAEYQVEQMLTASYGGFNRDPAWGYNGPFGSARVFVDVRPFLGESTIVRVASPVLSRIELSPELALRALEITSGTQLGHFSYLPERQELWFEHTLLGDALDPEEFQLAVDTVARIADGEDDDLARRFGGLRYADLTAG
jgi:hypothetical protein